MITFGEYLNSLRQNKKRTGKYYSLRDLSKILGITPLALSRLERNVDPPTEDKFSSDCQARLLDLFHITEDSDEYAIFSIIKGETLKNFKPIKFSINELINKIKEIPCSKKNKKKIDDVISICASIQQTYES